MYVQMLMILLMKLLYEWTGTLLLMDNKPLIIMGTESSGTQILSDAIKMKTLEDLLVYSEKCHKEAALFGKRMMISVNHKGNIVGLQRKIVVL